MYCTLVPDFGISTGSPVNMEMPAPRNRPEDILRETHRSGFHLPFSSLLYKVEEPLKMPTPILYSTWSTELRRYGVSPQSSNAASIHESSYINRPASWTLPWKWLPNVSPHSTAWTEKPDQIPCSAHSARDPAHYPFHAVPGPMRRSAPIRYHAFVNKTNKFLRARSVPLGYQTTTSKA